MSDLCRLIFGIIVDLISAARSDGSRDPRIAAADYRAGPGILLASAARCVNVVGNDFELIEPHVIFASPHKGRVIVLHDDDQGTPEQR